MNRIYAIRLSLSAIVVASIVIVLLHALGLWSAQTLPIYLRQQSNGHFLIQEPANAALPNPLLEGDALAPEAMTPAQRATVFYNLGVPPGSTVELAVLRGGRILRVRVPAQAAVQDWLRNAVTALLITPFLAALALLTLWRGRDRVAAGLCAISLYALVGKAMLALAYMRVAHYPPCM
jgi:hypothetical protein